MEKNTKFKKDIIQFLVIVAIIFLLNFIVSYLILRIDLTSENRYSLSEKTESLLAGLDDQVYIKIYLDGDDLPVGFKRMKRELNDMLETFNLYASKDVSFRYINPSKIEDKKARFGLYKELYDKGLAPIESEEVSEEGKSSQKLVFPCAVVVYKGKDIGVNLLKNDPRYKFDSEENVNNSIQSMEYEITNAIRKLTQPRKPQIAFIEGHGELDEYHVMDLTTALSEYYDVRTGAINGTPGILDSFLAIIIAKPISKFSEADKLIIDQYIMKGGKSLWLLDGAKINLDSLQYAPTTVAMPNETNLDDLLFRYGVRLNPGLLQDIQCSPIGLARKGMDSNPRIDMFPWPYYPIVLSSNSHAINKYVSLIRLEFASSLDTLGSSAKVKKQVLLQSSSKSRFDYAPVQVSIGDVKPQLDENIFKEKKLPVAVLLEGKFDSNFKNRIFENMVIPASAIIGESKDTRMIVVADGDIAMNEVSPKGDIYPVGFDINAKRPYPGNKEFLVNAINYLCDDEGLMSVRLREIKLRLLDKDKVSEHKTLWKNLNVVLPLVMVVLFALASWYLRKKKYTRNW